MRFQRTQYISDYLLTRRMIQPATKDATNKVTKPPSKPSTTISAQRSKTHLFNPPPPYYPPTAQPSPPNSFTLFGFWKGGSTTRHGSATSKTRQRTSTRKSRFARAAPDAFQPLFLMLKWRATFAGERCSLGAGGIACVVVFGEGTVVCGLGELLLPGFLLVLRNVTGSSVLSR